MNNRSIHHTKGNGTDRILVLVGNPNVGKSVLFQHLTGRYVTVSNYPGTTVDISTGTGVIDRNRYQVFDTPGTHNLSPKSEDEKVTRDLILSRSPDCLIQIADSKNLRRTLNFTLQLMGLGYPLILNLNMVDEARERGIQIDRTKLSETLGLPVYETIAVTGFGVPNLIKGISNVNPSQKIFTYDKRIEQGIQSMIDLLPCSIPAKRSVSIMILSDDDSVKSLYPEEFTEQLNLKLKSIIDNLQSQYSKPLSLVLAEQRQDHIDKILGSVIQTKEPLSTGLQESIGRWTIHPIGGALFALCILYIMHLFVGKFAAGTLVDLFEDTIFGQYINPTLSKWIHALIPIAFLQDMLVGEYGLFTMAITYAIALILPIVTAFFLFFGILEDSGYLPRLAIMMDRIFRAMGLNGKAVLPMVLGLGCDTMATLTTRILETKKERILTTLLLTLAIPCSAQLGVILGMLQSLSIIATLIWGGFVILIMLLVGYLAAKILPGQRSSFILEIPPIRIPQFSNILLKTIARLEWYLKEAVPLFIVATLALFILDRLSILVYIEKIASPIVVNWLGLPAEAAEAFLIGFLRRDYGAAGLYALSQDGLMTPTQIVVSLVTITLFVPCVAQFLVTIKERGFKTAIAISLFVLVMAFLVGGVLNILLQNIPITL